MPGLPVASLGTAQTNTGPWESSSTLSGRPGFGAWKGSGLGTEQTAAQPSDPFTLLTQQSNTSVEQVLAEVNNKRVALQKSIDPDRKAAYRDYLIDLKVLNNGVMPLEQKKRRAEALYASYQKKAYGIRDRIGADLDALTQVEQQAKGEFGLKQAMMQARMQAIAGFGKKLGLSDDDITREQFELLGVRLPQRQERAPQTPRQELMELNPVVQSMQQELNIYAASPAMRRSAFWNKEVPDRNKLKGGPLKVLKEEYRTPENMRDPAIYSQEDADTFRDATPEEQAQYEQLRQGISAGLSRMKELRGQVFQQHVPYLLGAVSTSSPLAASVAQAAPRAGGTRQIKTDDEYDALPSGAEFIDPTGTRRKKP